MGVAQIHKRQVVHVLFFFPNTIKGTEITQTVVILDLNSLSGKPRILTPKSTTIAPVTFLWDSRLPALPLRMP